jgi:hypothetical protein
MLPEWTVIGFSGHRKLADPKIVADGIRNAFERLTANHGPLAAVSSAASGSDTLFVEEVARRNLPYMLILPFPRERFQNDFDSADWVRVRPLIGKATHVEEVAGEESDDGAYMETGALTADRADVMVVVWDKKPAAGLGGTGDVVEYVRHLGKPLVIIDPATGNISEESLDQLPIKSLPADWNENPRQALETHFRMLDKKAEHHAPKSRLMVLGIVICQLAASAVGLTVLSLEKRSTIEDNHPAISLWTTGVELAFLFIAFFSSVVHRRKLDEWMKNRIEAEICRAFLATWDMRWRAEHGPYISIQGFDPLCKNLRLFRILDKTPPPPLEQVRDHYLSGRIAGQNSYFKEKGYLARMQFSMYRALWLSTTAVAMLCSLSAFLALFFHRDPSILKYFSLLLPLVSASCFLLIVTEDYSRRAVRYAEMSAKLENAGNRLRHAKTWNSLARIATETEEELVQEVIEWHSFRRFAGEPG